MQTIKNDQILLHFYVNNIIKWPGTSVRSPELNQKHVRIACHTEHQYLSTFHFDSTYDSKELSINVISIM